MRFTFFLVIAFVLPLSFFAQDTGYRIEVKLEGYDQTELFLGYHYGNKQYLRDTATVNDQGFFVFTGEEALPGGVYLVVLAPDNRFFQVLIDPADQHFRMVTNAEDPSAQMLVEGSAENDLFYNYVQFLGDRNPRAGELRTAIEQAGDNEQEKLALEKEYAMLNDEVLAYQRTVVDKYPASLTAALIRANLPMDYPEFTGTEEEVQIQRWRYTQEHFFDKMDLSDPRLLRTPFLFERVDYFVHKLQVQHPDTLSQAIDQVLAGMQPAEETFKFYLIHFLNEYARSNIVGMDAVYVHLVEKYYARGLAPWTEEEQLDKIIENADALKPLLIGKIAPDVNLEKRDGTKFSLQSVAADYTVLYFWRHDCGHCKESTPHMKAFYEKFKDRGVALLAVCVKFTDEIPACWEYVDENDIGDWLHAVDPYHRSRYSKIYNIKSTPQVYILDRNKEILSKRIGAEQLEEVMEKLMELREKESAEPGMSGGK